MGGKSGNSGTVLIVNRGDITGFGFDLCLMG